MNTGGLLKEAFGAGRLEPITWSEVRLRDVIFTVADDALSARLDDASLDDGKPLRLPVSYAEAIEILRAMDCISPTFEMCVAMYQQAARKPQYIGLVQTAADQARMMTLDFTRTFDARLEAGLSKEAKQTGLVFGPWKLWILDPLIGVLGAVNHGFWDRSKRPPAPIQMRGYKHDASHYDYSQLLQPVKRMARRASTGEPIDLLSWPRITASIPRRFLDPYVEGASPTRARSRAPQRAADPATGAPMPRLDLLAELIAAGVEVTPVAGWRERAVPGPFAPEGIMLHHTAGPKQGDAPSLTTCTNGRPDLAGPLCHLLVARSGQVHLISAGRANHAGKGAQQVLDLVRRGELVEGDAKDHGYVDGPLGNGDFYGIEVENDGLGEPYPDAQIDALARACSALCRAHAWGSERVIHHRQWTHRKIDMSYAEDLHGAIDAALLL